MPEICFYPKNVWHEFWDRIENVGFYTHPRSMFPSQQMFSTNIRRELKMLGFIHILELCFHPQMFGTKIMRELKMLAFIHILEICFHPTNVWHKSWDRIENFGFYTHPINMFPPPKCLA